MKRIFLACTLAIINCYASRVIRRSSFAQARASIADDYVDVPDYEYAEPPQDPIPIPDIQMDESTIDSIPYSYGAPSPYNDYGNNIYEEVGLPNYDYDEQLIPIPEPDVIQMDDSTIDNVPTNEEVESIPTQS